MSTAFGSSMFENAADLQAFTCQRAKRFIQKHGPSDHMHAHICMEMLLPGISQHV